MRIKQFFIIFSAAMLLSSLVGCHSQDKTAPVEDEYPEFTMAEPADYPVMNATIDNPVLGDEHYWARIGGVPSDGDELTTDDVRDFATEQITLEAGKSYLLMLYCHNSADYNLGAEAAVTEQSFTISLPNEIKANTGETLSALLSYRDPVNDKAQILGCNITLDATEDLRIDYHTGYQRNGEAEHPVTSCVDDLTQWGIPSATAYAEKDHVIFQGLGTDVLLPGYEYAGYIVLKFEVLAR